MVSYYDSLVSRGLFKQAQDIEKSVYAGENDRVLPNRHDVFRSLQLVPYDSLRVVILGQDPYHTKGYPTGLAFSVPHGVSIPPSLRNIFQELARDLQDVTFLDRVHHKKGSLDAWAKQGVLLLNTIYTVEQGKPLSHSNKGWDKVSRMIIQDCSDTKHHCVFLLWGSHAQSYQSSIHDRHTVYTASHPSPLSAYRGFVGCRHFSQANKSLVKHFQEPISWNLY